jgi:hypothetical protein
VRPAEILRWQIDLSARLGDPRDRVAQAMDFIMTERNDGKRAELAANVAAHIRHGRAYLVTADMLSVLQSRFESERWLPGTTHCPRDIAPPRPSGFIVFEEPIAFRELRGRVQLIHVLTWGPTEARLGNGRLMPGWAMGMFNDIARRPDDVAKEMIAEGEQLTRWQPIGGLWLARDERIGRPYRTLSDEERADYVAAHPGGPEIQTYDHPNLPRYLVALWQLFAETIETRGVTRAETQRPDRPGWRAAKRAQIDTDITVITLRHESKPVEHPGTGTPLGWRVPVTEHHRTYWVKDADGVLRPEKRKIGLHWRGPEDAPERVTRKLERLAR